MSPILNNRGQSLTGPGRHLLTGHLGVISDFGSVVSIQERRVGRSGLYLNDASDYLLP